MDLRVQSMKHEDQFLAHLHQNWRGTLIANILFYNILISYSFCYFSGKREMLAASFSGPLFASICNLVFKK